MNEEKDTSRIVYTNPVGTTWSEAELGTMAVKLIEFLRPQIKDATLLRLLLRCADKLSGEYIARCGCETCLESERLTRNAWKTLSEEMDHTFMKSRESKTQPLSAISGMSGGHVVGKC